MDLVHVQRRSDECRGPVREGLGRGYGTSTQVDLPYLQTRGFRHPTLGLRVPYRSPLLRKPSTVPHSHLGNTSPTRRDIFCGSFDRTEKVYTPVLLCDRPTSGLLLGVNLVVTMRA